MQSEEMQAAEQELRQAEEAWQTANREYQKSISDLASWRPIPLAPVESETKELSQFSAWSAWVIAGIPIVALVVLALGLHFRSQTGVLEARPLGVAKRHATRIVYKPQSTGTGSNSRMQPRLDVAPQLPSHRAPIVPRRRNASNC
jgi:hypothetical protein